MTDTTFTHGLDADTVAALAVRVEDAEQVRFLLVAWDNWGDIRVQPGRTAEGLADDLDEVRQFRTSCGGDRTAMWVLIDTEHGAVDGGIHPAVEQYRAQAGG